MEWSVTSEEIEQAMPAAFDVANRTLDMWGFSDDEKGQVLGIDPETLRRFQSKGLPSEHIGDDLVSRVSLVLGIERGLEVLLGAHEDIGEWVNRSSDAPLFGGRSPKSVMLEGRLDDLREIRAYVDGWCSGDFA